MKLAEDGAGFTELGREVMFDLQQYCIELAKQKGIWKEPENLDEMTVFEFVEYMTGLIIEGQNPIFLEKIKAVQLLEQSKRLVRVLRHRN